MNNYSWESSFRNLFEKCAQLHRAGQTSAATWFSEAEFTFLQSIGYSVQEFFDFVDDHCRYDDGPTLETSLLVASVRRDFLRIQQKGKTSTHTVSPTELPAKAEAVEGIPWLPRLIAKARAKLRGEMDPDTMFGCGGDRSFFVKYDINSADFLRVTWAAGDDDRKIIDYVKSGGQWA